MRRAALVVVSVGIVVGLATRAPGLGARTGGGPRPPSAPAGTGTVSSGGRGQLQVSFLDVGQGDAALVLTPDGKSLLVDGGPGGAGPRVLEALRAAGVAKVDWLIGSHPHEDHIGGLLHVLRAMPAVQVLDPGYNHGSATQQTYLSLLKQCGAQTTLARAGQTYNLGPGCRLEIAAPVDPLLSGTEADVNNNSIVARLVYGQTRFLFAGDMEEEQRKRLLGSAVAAAGVLPADVLKVSHHGSFNGTDAPFLRAVAPRFAVISCGRGNDYGYPHRDALEALRKQGCQVLRTDEQGTIRFTSDGERVRLEGAPTAPQGVPAPAGRDQGASGAGATGGGAGRPVVVPNRDSRTWVIGNRDSRVYHRPDCGLLPAPVRRVMFASGAHAEASGYRPHRACVR